MNIISLCIMLASVTLGGYVFLSFISVAWPYLLGLACVTAFVLLLSKGN